MILARSCVDRATKSRLKKTFEEFLLYYDSARHFGKNRDEEKYRTINRLTLQELNRFRCMTIEVWDVVIEIFRDDAPDDFRNFGSISEAVQFENLAK